MKIKILGSRANVEPRTPYHTRFAGVLIDEILLVDAGERSFMKEKFHYLLFTHLHPDHAFFIRDKEKFTPGLACYAPEQHELIPQLEIITCPTDVGPYHILPVPVIHSLKVKSLGYVIERNEKRIFISGDVAWIEKKYQEDFGRFDLVITDGSWIRKGGMIRRDKKTDQIFGHTGIPNLVGLFEGHTHFIIFTHLGSWFIKDVPEGRTKLKKFNRDDLRIEPAYDGMSIEI
jgi:hypothetical protein